LNLKPQTILNPKSIDLENSGVPNQNEIDEDFEDQNLTNQHKITDSKMTQQEEIIKEFENQNMMSQDEIVKGF